MMVLTSILGLSLSFIPCIMIGFIMFISFLLCNCEYIGESVAKHFCALKNRFKRRRRLRPIKCDDGNGNGNKSKSGEGRNTNENARKSCEMRQLSSTIMLEHCNANEVSSSRRKIISKTRRGGDGDGSGELINCNESFESDLASAPSLSPSPSIVEFGSEDGIGNPIGLDWDDGSNGIQNEEVFIEGNGELFDPPPPYEECIRGKCSIRKDQNKPSEK